MAERDVFVRAVMIISNLLKNENIYVFNEESGDNIAVTTEETEPKNSVSNQNSIVITVPRENDLHFLIQQNSLDSS